MLKKIVSMITLTGLTIAQAGAQQGGAPTVVVRRGTVLKFSTLAPFDSATAKVGDDVPLRLTRPLIVDGVTLMEVGEIVHGKVAQVKHARPHCKDGFVVWKLDRVSFADQSTAATSVWMIQRNARVEVPEEVPWTPKEKDPPVVYALVPFVLVFVAILEIAEFLDYVTGHNCVSAGTEYQLPANAVVAVRVRKDHKVHYHPR